MLTLDLDILGFNPHEEAKKATRLHRYEQQVLFTFCLEFIRQCASDDYQYDGRNEEAAHKAVRIVNAYNEVYHTEM